MIIEPLTYEAAIKTLSDAKVARLGCAKDDQPFVVPISIAYARDYIYAFSTVGRKIEWMRINPRVCIEVEEVASRQDWRTVIVLGLYEELNDNPELRDLAHNLLSRSGNWWEPGYVTTTLPDGTWRPLDPIYFRISVKEISGHQGIPR